MVLGSSGMLSKPCTILPIRPLAGFALGIFGTLLICSPAPHWTLSAKMHTVVLVLPQEMETSLHPGARFIPKPVTLFRNRSHKSMSPMDEGDLLIIKLMVSIETGKCYEVINPIPPSLSFYY